MGQPDTIMSVSVDSEGLLGVFSPLKHDATTTSKPMSPSCILTAEDPLGTTALDPAVSTYLLPLQLVWSLWSNHIGAISRDCSVLLSDMKLV